MARVAVIGTTTWGTTLSILLARKGTRVRLWARTEAEAVQFRERREHPLSLPGIPFPPSLSVTSRMAEVVGGAEMVILAVPAQAMRANIRAVQPYLLGSPLLLSAAKGLERESGLRMSQVLASELPPALHPSLVVLSGPNIAREIVRGLPAAAVVASGHPAAASKARELLSTPSFHLQVSADVVGVELGGALKNVITIAAGIVEGLGYGDNARAALMARGLAEMMAFGAACGAQPETFLGLAGMGDLVVTSTSPLSRNHRVGLELARGRSPQEVLTSLREVAEGVPTAFAARNLAQRLKIAAPITQHVYEVVFEGLPPAQAAPALLWDQASPPEG